MPDAKTQTEAFRSFLERFQAFNAVSDVDGLAGMYAPDVMIAGPNGTQVITRADLLKVIPRRKQLFEAAGCRKTTLLTVDPAVLTERYSLLRTEWQWTFEHEKRGRVVVTLPSTFIVDVAGERPRIALYMIHEDVATVLRERGLLS